MPIEAADLFAAQAAAEREEDLHSLPELFLENAKLRPHQVPTISRRLGEVISLPEKGPVLWQTFKSYPSSPRVPLPPPLPVSNSPSSDQVLRLRPGACGGERVFGTGPLEVEHLSLLLLYAYGVVRRGLEPVVTREMLDVRPPPYVRSCPSAGNLYPLELYVATRDVRRIPAGVYHYNASGHYLELVREDAGVAASVDALFPEVEGHGGAAAVVVITAVPLRTAWLYADRGYRMLLTESGRAAQNLYLGGVALGLNVFPITHFFDDAAHRLLDVDGLDEIAVDVSLVGPAHTDPATGAAAAPAP